MATTRNIGLARRRIESFRFDEGLRMKRMLLERTPMVVSHPQRSPTLATIPISDLAEDPLGGVLDPPVAGTAPVATRVLQIWLRPSLQLGTNRDRESFYGTVSASRRSAAIGPLNCPADRAGCAKQSVEVRREMPPAGPLLRRHILLHHQARREPTERCRSSLPPLRYGCHDVHSRDQHSTGPITQVRTSLSPFA